MKLLIIGLGSIAKKHLIAIRELFPSPKIYALRSSASQAIEKDVNDIFSFDEVPADIDFIIISNITSLHADTIIRSAELKVPLMIEKPLVMSLSEINGVLKIVEQNDIISYVACNLRFHPAILFLKNVLNENHRRINEVNIYCGSFLPNWRSGKDFKESYSTKPALGGGVHLDLIHEIDYCTWLFGMPVHADVIKRNVSTLDIEAVDYVNYRLTYPNFVATIILNYFRKDTKRHIEILFQDTTWTIDLVNCEIKDHEQQIIFKQELKPMDTYIAQMKYFYKHVLEKTKPMNSVNEAAENLKICLANE